MSTSASERIGVYQLTADECPNGSEMKGMTSVQTPEWITPLCFHRATRCPAGQTHDDVTKARSKVHLIRRFLGARVEPLEYLSWGVGLHSRSMNERPRENRG